jgi:hypothetical protein
LLLFLKCGLALAHTAGLADVSMQGYYLGGSSGTTCTIKPPACANSVPASARTSQPRDFMQSYRQNQTKLHVTSPCPPSVLCASCPPVRVRHIEPCGQVR